MLLKKNKKAQIDIIAYIVVIIGILILAPILLHLVNVTTTKFSEALNQSAPDAPDASISVAHIGGVFTNWLDTIIVIAFLVNIVLLFVFAFSIDTHPLFLLFYIISAVFTMIFSPYVLEPVKAIMGMSEFSDAVLKLPMTGFIINKFSILLLGIIVLTGIILYAKFRGRQSDL